MQFNFNFGKEKEASVNKPVNDDVVVASPEEKEEEAPVNTKPPLPGRKRRQLKEDAKSEAPAEKKGSKALEDSDLIEIEGHKYDPNVRYRAIIVRGGESNATAAVITESGLLLVDVYSSSFIPGSGSELKIGRKFFGYIQHRKSNNGKTRFKLAHVTFNGETPLASVIDKITGETYGRVVKLSKAMFLARLYQEGLEDLETSAKIVLSGHLPYAYDDNFLYLVKVD